MQIVPEYLSPTVCKYVAGFNIFIDEEELRTLGMMTGKLNRQERYLKRNSMVFMFDF